MIKIRAKNRHHNYLDKISFSENGGAGIAKSTPIFCVQIVYKNLRTISRFG